MNIKTVLIIMSLILIFCPIVYAETPMPIVQQTAVANQQMIQQMNIILTKQVGDLEKKLIENEDLNFQQLDSRVNEAIAEFKNKILFGLIGIMSIFLPAYAYIVNWISRRYNSIYQRNLVKQRLSRAEGRGLVVVPESEDYYPESKNNPYSKPVYTEKDCEEKFTTSIFDKYIQKEEKEINQKEIIKDVHPVKKKRRWVKWLIISAVILVIIGAFAVYLASIYYEALAMITQGGAV